MGRRSSKKNKVQQEQAQIRKANSYQASAQEFFCEFCQKKIYPMKFEADAVAEHQVATGQVAFLKSYECPRGMGYHLTSDRGSR